MSNIISKEALCIAKFAVLSVTLQLLFSSFIVPNDIGVSRVDFKDPVKDDLRGKSILVHPVHMHDSLLRRLLLTKFFSRRLKKIVGDTVVQIIQTKCMDEEMIDDYPDSFIMDALRTHHHARFLALTHANIQMDSDDYKHILLTISILDLETHQYVYDQ